MSEIDVRDRTGYALLYGAQIARGDMPNHEFCDHGVCRHCLVDAEDNGRPCDLKDPWPGHPDGCRYCREEAQT